MLLYTRMAGFLSRRERGSFKHRPLRNSVWFYSIRMFWKNRKKLTIDDVVELVVDDCNQQALPGVNPGEQANVENPH